MQMKWTAVALAALTLVACGKKEEAAAPAAAPAPTAAAPAAAPPGATLVVKIGHVAPTSGAIAHLGKDNELGAKMAIEDLNAKGLKIGDKTAKFELLAEDDAADPKQGTAVAQKLVDSKVNGVVGHLNSGTTIPASKLYSDAGIPQVSPSATNPKYTRQGFKTTFRVVADDTQLGGTLGKYAVETLKGKNIAVIDDRTAYGQGVAEEFEKAAKAAGATIVGHEFTTDKSTDFNAILTKLKGAKPDVLFFGGMDAVGGPMLKQVKQLGMTVKFMGGDGLCTAELAKLAGDAIGEDMVVCAEAGGVDGDFKAPLEAWKTKFKEKNGVEVQIYAPYVYDAVNVLAAAMVKAGSAEPEKYLPEVGKVDYKGLTGPITFDEKGDIKNGALTLYTYKGGARTQIAVVR
ncbi:branched-chain amino acid ABC transporter substrate-binding protein [Variovorax arabinosiphilus]|uniref:branched-chain amino acid ABC transporter substrate-binding protein n=1 Tax=Variovorax arabinosiphilus TaxID=3053498 RepID=UPI002577D778|nr:MULTISPECIES: branched-chain amino acid ABC transporter substrate-binding protein [unclassified Variovorax]MDM0118894.1 branched-chain amino acid ABC transporter substrate-binding protein [Variovorax sp. J2L1-78]MDM0129319.1 branched-chain amino acid ABC transporter substrate-binding protein [Variovorax sp. J2L1-63]MDM0232894.1 branched-chain amino acid ABC transporter substrate-binding protein [Variovorax sp. J2R1-6]